MSVSVNAGQLIKFLNIGAELKTKGVGLSAFIHGLHGIGKSAIVKQWCLDNDYQHVPLFLSMMDTVDLLGMPFKDRGGATRFGAPDWLHDLQKDPRPAVVFVDEINRATPAVLNTMLPFVLTGKLHTHSLREQDIIVAAANPDAAEYNVTSFEDEALMSRFAHLYFEPEPIEWIIHASGDNVHSSVIDVIKENPQMLKDTRVPEDSRVKASVNNRGLSIIGQAFSVLSKEQVEEMGFFLCSALIGMDAAAPIMASYRESQIPKVEDILNGEALKKLDLKKDLDKVMVLVDGLIAFMAARDFKMWRKNSKEMKNVQEFIAAIALDSQYAFVRGLNRALDASGKDTVKIAEIMCSLDSELVCRAFSGKSND